MLINEVIEKASEYFGIKEEEIVYNGTKKKEIVTIRQFISALCSELKFSDDNVGVALNLDRTTILNARRRFDFQYNQYQFYKDDYDEFKDFTIPSELKLNKKIILAFPAWDEYEKMTTHDLALVKQKINILEDHIKRIIRKRIQ